MTIRTYDITLDSYDSVLPEPVIIRRGDKTGAVTINAQLLDRNQPINLTGKKLVFYAMTADNQALVADPAVTISDATQGRISYPVNGAVAQRAGKIETAYFSIEDGGTQSTYDIRFVVLKSADMSADHAEDYIGVLDELIGKFEHALDDIKAQIDAAVADMNSRLDTADGRMTDVEDRVSQALADLEAGDFYTKTESDTQFVKSGETPQNLLAHTNSPSYSKGNGTSNGATAAVFAATSKLSQLPSGHGVWLSFDAEVANPDGGNLAFGLEDSPYKGIARTTLDHSGHYFISGTLPRQIATDETIVMTVDKSATVTKITNVAMYHVNKDYGYHPAASMLVSSEPAVVNLIAEGAYFDQNASNGHDADERHGNWTVGAPNSAGVNLTTGKHNFYHNGRDNMLILSATEDKEVFVQSSTFGVSEGERLSWALGLFGTGNTNSVDVFMIFNNGARNLIDKYTPSPSQIEYLSGGIRVPSGATSAYFRVDNNGTNNSSSASIYLAEMQVVRRAGVYQWAPSVEEFNRTNLADGRESWQALTGRNADDFMVDSYGLKTGYIQGNVTNNPAGSDSVRVIQTSDPNHFGIAFGLSGNPDKGMFTRVMAGSTTPNPWYKVPYANYRGVPNTYAGNIAISNASTAFDDYTQPGYYGFSGICHAKNLPASFEGKGMYGGLVVWSSGGVIFQEFHWDSAHVHRIITRSRAGAPAAWGAWREYQFAAIN